MVQESKKTEKKVLDIDAYRTREGRAQVLIRKCRADANEKSRAARRRDYRSDVYARVDDEGNVDFQIARMDRADAPVIVVACLIMGLQLAQLIAETGS